FYLFSDGYADQFGGPKGKKFMYKKLKEMLLSIQDKTMQEQFGIIDKTIEEWRGDLFQVDDQLIIGVKI
ncbi:MAG: histidine kinase, partial [Bacteroidetes bacterium CG02_land_8_20_14_3_00_31_25]